MMEKAENPSLLIEGRNEVIEAFRSGRTIDRIFVLDGSHDGKLETIRREAKKAGLRVDYVDRKRLDELSESGNHQGVIARAAAYSYASVEDILERAEKKQEAPFIFLLDGIEDPHNLGAIIRTADLRQARSTTFPLQRSQILRAPWRILRTGGSGLPEPIWTAKSCTTAI